MKRLKTLLTILTLFTCSVFAQNFLKLSVGSPSLFMCSDSCIYVTSDYENLDLGYTNDYLHPIKFDELDGIKDFAAGIGFSLFLLNDGSVYAKGINNLGQQGNGSIADDDISITSLHKIDALKDITKVYASKTRAAAIDKNGDVWIWGNLKGFNTGDLVTPWPVKLPVANVAEIDINGPTVLLINKDTTYWSFLNGILEASELREMETEPVYGNYSTIGFGQMNQFVFDISDPNDCREHIGINILETLPHYNSLTFYLYCDDTWDHFITIDHDVKQMAYNCYQKKDETIWSHTSSHTPEIEKFNSFYNFADAKYIDFRTIKLNKDYIIVDNKSLYLNCYWDYGIINNETYEVITPERMACSRKKINWLCCSENPPDSVVLDSVIIPGTDILLTASNSIGNQYNWAPLTEVPNPTSQSTIVNIDSNTTFSVSLYDNIGCVYKDELFKLQIRDCDTIITQSNYLMLDTTVYKGSQIVLHASESYSTYSWKPSSDLSCTNCSDPVFECDDNEVLYVTLFNEWICPYTEMFSVQSKNRFIPDIITPNGDGFNDYFEIADLKENTALKIFNRYGELVYSNSNYQNDWDGSDNNGNPLSQENYFYLLKIQEEIYEYKGSVFVKR
jgi:gliding motility-associated-like protein